MNLSEFKAWFTGFTEFMPGAPTEKQWDRIKERVGEIDGKPITQTVYIDRYVDRYPYRPYWTNGPSVFGSSLSSGGMVLCNAASAEKALYFSAVDDPTKWEEDNTAGSFKSEKPIFDGETAMNALGAAEFKEMMQ